MKTTRTRRSLLCFVVLSSLATAVSAQFSSFQRIGDGEGGFVGPIAPGDGFGSSAAALGDLDGNGVPDLAVGAPGDQDGGPAGVGNGAVWILFLEADGTVSSEQKISATQGGLVGLPLNTAFASSLTALGDVDGDGVVDLAAGAPFDTDGVGFFASGAVWILLLNADGTVKAQQKISETQGGLPTSTAFSAFGNAVAGLGDLDGDGRVELAVGAPTAEITGEVRVLSLEADGTVFREVRIGSGLGGFTGTIGGSENFASSVAAPGDLDGDGVSDLIVGMPRGLANQSVAVGVVWVLFLNTDATVKGFVELDLDSGRLPMQLDEDDQFGESVAAAGDLNGDGVLDIAVGAPGDDDGGPERGALYVLHMTATGEVVVERKISSAPGSLEGQLPDGAFFGAMAASLGDLDGNGVGELVTAGDGSVWILFLDPPVLASSTFRSAGANPASLTVSLPAVGSDLHLEVDTLASGHGFALPFAFDTPVDVTLGGGQVLLALDLGGRGEILQLPGPLLGPLASFDASFPNVPDLWGFTATVQAVVFGGTLPFALTNAYDLVFGYDPAP